MDGSPDGKHGEESAEDAVKSAEEEEEEGGKAADATSLLSCWGRFMPVPNRLFLSSSCDVADPCMTAYGAPPLLPDLRNVRRREPGYRTTYSSKPRAACTYVLGKTI